MQLTRTHRMLIGVVVAGAVVIAGIGFAGSYTAVRELALKKGFGSFAYFFPIGIDAGICVLLALDLLLTWIRMPFPMLRQTAWLLTAATIAFNGAASWGDPLGVAMHAVIPVLFVVTIEAARHAVGRIADITADKHMEGVRLTRWLLSPVPTFKLWRRMKLWELRSYEQVIKLEQDRLVYQARLQARFGRGWRRKAPVESLMPLRLARIGVPLAETAPAGLAAAGIEPVLIPPGPQQPAVTADLTKEPHQPELTAAPAAARETAQEAAQEVAAEDAPAGAHQSPWFAAHNASYAPVARYDEWYAEQERLQQEQAQAQHRPQTQPQPQPQEQAQAQAQAQYEQQQFPQQRSPEHAQEFPVPNGAGGTRPLGDGIPQSQPQPQADDQVQQHQAQAQQHPQPEPEPAQEPEPAAGPEPAPAAPAVTDEDLYQVFRYSIGGEGMPTPGAFAANVEATYGLRLQSRELNTYMDRFTARLNDELMEDHIA
ncbi:DUF2637 domain-containing protein [Streptomyces luteocolor]|uniref:DUF2637 domain-containing protein n=1 Tax=Streptomyces luteocolor TaxID=285500 RepID=UPI000853A6D7|nr:DUF2637 domain-containing protein [Streptomyces luteocolor]